MARIKAEPSDVRCGTEVTASNTERPHVATAEKNSDMHFMCILCNAELTKGGAFKYYTRQLHGPDPNILMQWSDIDRSQPYNLGNPLGFALLRTVLFETVGIVSDIGFKCPKP